MSTTTGKDIHVASMDAEAIAVIKKNGSPKSGYWEIVDKYLYFIGPYFIGSNHDILY